MARTRKPTAESDAFLAGVLTALEHLHGHDQETIHSEIVQEVGARELVDFARRDELCGNGSDFGGLIKYGWATKSGNYKRQRR